MKAIEQYFFVVMFVKMVLTFESADEILKLTIQMKATEQHFPEYLLLCSSRWLIKYVVQFYDNLR